MVRHGSSDYLAVARVAAVLGAASIPALLDPGAIREAASLHALAESAHPYWVPSHALLLYFRAPLVVISSCILVLAPGLIFALATATARTIAAWMLSGFILSLVVVSIATSAVQEFLGRPLVQGGFVITLGFCALLATAFVCFRVSRGHAITRPWSTLHAGTTIAAAILPAFAMVALMAPKFFWESFNADGVHTLEAAALLLSQSLPFFPPDAGPVAGFPGIATMLYAYPLSWFLRLFGDMEASVRVPWVLFLSVLFCSILTFAEEGRRPLARSSRWLIWAALAVYSVTMAFSATYSPYAADIALPATQDTLFIALFLAYVIFFLRGNTWWMVLTVVLVYTALPSGMMLMVLWSAAAWFLLRASRRLIVVTAVAALGCTMAAAIAPTLLDIAGLPVPGRENRASTFMWYFAFIRLDDWQRVLYMLLPGGILPALSLALWKRQDAAARSLTLVTIAYFLLFYVQASIALHHFVPAMLLPIAVFWRQEREVESLRRAPFIAAVVGAAAVAMILSFPRHESVYVAAREVGSAFQDRFPHGTSMSESYRRFRLVSLLFPGYMNRDITRDFVISPIAVRYYASHPAEGERSPAYAIVPRSAPQPSGRLAGQDSTASLFVLSDSAWKAHLALRPPEPAGSPIYAIPSVARVRTNELRHAPGVISLTRALGRIGVDTMWLRRVGGKR